VKRPLRRLPAAALAVLSAAGHGLAGEGTIATKDLTGRWLKATTDACAELYPAELLLRPGGIYEAPGGPEVGAVWHSGGWRLEGGAFVIQMANDEMRPYRLETPADDELAITDAEDCRVVYRRESR
jgi:hypothetical protein